MFVVSEINYTSMALFEVNLSNGKIMAKKKLNTGRLRDSIHLCVDMYNIFISGDKLTHICIYYASGIIRYYSIEKLGRYSTSRCQGVAYVAHCNSISVLLYPYSTCIRIYNLAL